MSRRKELLLAVTSVMISLVTFLGFAEIVLRFLPVADSMLNVPVTTNDPIMHFTPNRSVVFSRDWDLHLANRVHINNDGWVNDQDYREDDTTPLLAIVGDSFIEAVAVPYAETLQGRLAKALDGKLRVYSFAASGAPLSQYLMWARYAVRKYNAKALIINVVGNDFDESYVAYRSTEAGFWLYVPTAEGQLRLRLFEFSVGPIRTLVKHSALARYLFINMHLRESLSHWDWLRRLGGWDRVRYAGNTTADADPPRINTSLAVIDAFFRDLPEVVGLPPDRVTFIQDGFRYPDAAAKGKDTYFDRMRRAFREKAEAGGYEVIDVDPLFFADFHQHGKRFEDLRDYHWNAHAHSVVANAVMSSRLLARFPLQPQ